MKGIGKNEPDPLLFTDTKPDSDTEIFADTFSRKSWNGGIYSASAFNDMDSEGNL